MKLIVQIPCFNEETTLARVIADIPRNIDGIDLVELLVIDDGSFDQTVRVARENGVEHILVNKKNIGLARSFQKGMVAALKAEADIIVNTDGDNQYAGSDIAKLVQPIIKGEADIVVGDRRTSEVKHFSRTKKILQRIGSALVRKLSGISIPDAVSGFRALSREAAIRINIVSSFSYTIEMLIQAGKRGMCVVSVPVKVNDATRESRLFQSVPEFLIRSAGTMVRVYSMYKPLKVFFLIGTFFTLVGFLPIVRFLFLYFSDDGAGHIQSLVLGGAFLLMGFVAYMIGLVTDLIASNRVLLEMTLERVKRLELSESRTLNENDMDK
ncbi:MAG: glycosyltransferase family 2 protein [Chromatiaceae bacterium]|nr:glycosyltransferase family 2 protein [Chromatiaceae bacterium]